MSLEKWLFLSVRNNTLSGTFEESEFYLHIGPSDGSCDSIVSSHSLVTNQTFSGHTNWTYHQCLDVDECRLGLHKCHEKAECINTEGPEDSYECLCEQGYMGNGTHCKETYVL